VATVADGINNFAVSTESGYLIWWARSFAADASWQAIPMLR
jgi:hypothetical protein